ncbi:MAG TPA: MFS transporter [Solirubrobacteraceae bacterium]|nr:MFS transporter [Solirubrobacteraceae bacterium]
MSDRAGGWAPLGYPDFCRLWLAQFTSNVGSWMQTVAAQWVMTTLTSSALLLSAIQAAGSIPVLLLAIPAGALGDLVDRKRLIFGGQLTMLAAAAALAVISAAGALTPWVLIALLFVIGVGGALGASTWQTLQPELAPGEIRSQAIALGSVNQNLARAVGPAIGGVLLAATSAALVFGVNAVSFVAVLGAVLVTRIPVREQTMPRERAFGAVRAGGRLVANSPVLLALIARATIFVFFAGAIWAVLPLVARGRLHLGSGGYGLLLGCVGIGALLAANLGPALKQRVSPPLIYALACALVAATAAVLALTHTVALAAVMLVLAGASWITALGVLSTGAQSQLPAWAKARGFAYYLVAFQGANGIGSLAIGGVAQGSSVRTALLVVAGGLVACLLLTLKLPLPDATGADLHLADPLPLAEEPAETHGPVVVTVAYAVRDEQSDRFLALAGDLRRMRRRTGAIHWHLNRDLDDAGLFTETFVTGSWEEHERQHVRVEHGDQQLLAQIDALLRDGQPRAARHALAVRPGRRTASFEVDGSRPAPR